MSVRPRRAGRQGNQPQLRCLVFRFIIPTFRNQRGGPRISAYLAVGTVLTFWHFHSVLSRLRQWERVALCWGKVENTRLDGAKFGRRFSLGDLSGG